MSLFDLEKAERRRRRVRLKLRSLSSVRLSVFKSNRHFYAQLIDDGKGETVAAASTLESEVLSVACRRVNAGAVKVVAKLLASRIDGLDATYRKFVFDRGSYRYMGVIAVFADELRSLGFEF
ncbi:50S ribosomal protein L18 [Candidatus Anaplasma sp. TIGMIC]|uniref:50S ribosomal protein L18 n=1 Tax=Candidatus Anaplasma sp. TIGMIC TaxID=3020713 RepID=UPI00232D98E2|nr:50S ribosomal protein L18 [Candidatus Anaplasma sp. TIGMIC]MDB1135244.1 50S ribosomal protein L18 [Candidatus Anaplasma sp. TIGMIC]